MFNWFATANAERFGKELAAFILSELELAVHKRDAKFAARADKVLIRAAQQIMVFRSRERLNFYKRAKLANAFLWTLKDGKCEEGYANQLTDWLTLRL
jgi:hypothetical protein